MKAVVKIGLNDCGVKSRYLGPSGGTASLFALANARDQNADYGNGPPKIILKCLRKRTWTLRRFRSFCVCAVVPYDFCTVLAHPRCLYQGRQIQRGIRNLYD